MLELSYISNNSINSNNSGGTSYDELCWACLQINIWKIFRLQIMSNV